MTLLIKGLAGLVLAATLFTSGSTVLSTEAEAAQVYVCTCNGERKRFFASTRYCEKKTGVKQCTREQYRKLYSKVCRERGCRLPG